MSDIISYQPVRALDRNGDPVPGALARFYLSGTTTPATVFQDLAELVPHPTQIEADANGMFPAVFRSGVALKAVVTTPGGAVLPGFPMDPVLTVGSGGGASQISFEATGSIPVSDVQAAIEFVFANAASAAAGAGIGVTGDAPILANVDATNTPSGFYRFTDTTTGTLPPGWAGQIGTISLHRENASNARVFAARRGDAALFTRSLTAGTWQGWERYDLRPLVDSAWTDGADADPATPSPAQIKAAVEALAPRLSQSQVENATGTTFGAVSGQRLTEAFQAREQQLGIGQTWQSLLTSRAAETTYTNSTGRPIQIFIRGRSSSGDTTLIVRPNSLSGWVVAGVLANDAPFLPIHAVIPPGHQYRLNGAVSVLQYWSELR
jgi:hypothetical protein